MWLKPPLSQAIAAQHATASSHSAAVRVGANTGRLVCVGGSLCPGPRPLRRDRRGAEECTSSTVTAVMPSSGATQAFAVKPRIKAGLAHRFVYAPSLLGVFSAIADEHSGAMRHGVLSLVQSIVTQRASEGTEYSHPNGDGAEALAASSGSRPAMALEVGQCADGQFAQRASIGVTEQPVPAQCFADQHAARGHGAACARRRARAASLCERSTLRSHPAASVRIGRGSPTLTSSSVTPRTRSSHCLMTSTLKLSPGSTGAPPVHTSHRLVPVLYTAPVSRPVLLVANSIAVGSLLSNG